jgi:hypothetical protein
MKRLLFFLAAVCVLLACAPLGLSQSTQVSGQVLAPDGFAWQAGTGNFAIQCAGNSQPYINGSPVSRNIPLVRLDGTGSFSQSLWDMSFLTDVNNQPLACQWQANFLDNCGIATFGVLFTGITGSSVTVTSQISAVSVPLSAACTPPGILNSVTLSNLTPLFTVTKTGTLTDPIFTFNAISEAQGLVYASPAVGSGLPTFRALVASDLPAGTGTVTAVTASSPITSTGGTAPNIACPTCVDAVNGTTNQITSSGGTTPTLSIPSTFIAPGSVRATTALRGATITDDGLTAGKCVQAGTAGLLTTTANPCPNISASQIQTAVIASPCTPPSANSYDACNSTVTWPTAFADTSYNVVCNAFGPGYNTGTAGNNNSNNIFVGSVTVNNATIIIQNNRGAQDTPNAVLCIAAHP